MVLKHAGPTAAAGFILAMVPPQRCVFVAGSQRPRGHHRVAVAVRGKNVLGAHEVARRHVLLLRLPGLEKVEGMSVAVELQGVHRNTAVQ
jgi:hypothetical protein